MKSVFRKILYPLALVAVLNVFVMREASAHCDGMDGPVIKEAQRALAIGDVTPLLKWVPAADEGEISAAFARTLRVRKLGSEAQELVDRQFYATLVEVHRAAEGAPFTGIKPAGSISPAVTAADAALVDGDIDPLVADITRDVEQGIRLRFAATMKAKARAEASVPEGREFVSKYVEYVHFVERLHGAINASSQHAYGEARAVSAAHEH